MALLAAALVASVAGTAQASVLRALTVQQLRDGADAIVSGKVVRVRSVRTGGTVETVVRVRVQHAWRGPADRILVVRTPGGVAAGHRLIVAGAPTFERGQHLLLFLERDGAAWRPVGLFQGVWHVDPERPQAAVASSPAGAALVRSASGAVAAVDPGERSVRELVGRAGGER